MRPAIPVAGLTRRYRSPLALDDVSFDKQKAGGAMSLNGGWAGYGGDAKIELAAGLLAVAGCAAYAGIRLRRPMAPPP